MLTQFESSVNRVESSLTHFWLSWIECESSVNRVWIECESSLAQRSQFNLDFQSYAHKLSILRAKVCMLVPVAHALRVFMFWSRCSMNWTTVSSDRHTTCSSSLGRLRWIESGALLAQLNRVWIECDSSVNRIWRTCAHYFIQSWQLCLWFII